MFVQTVVSIGNSVGHTQHEYGSSNSSALSMLAILAGLKIPIEKNSIKIKIRLLCELMETLCDNH